MDYFNTQLVAENPRTKEVSFQARNRRGVLLIVVLSMLMLFLLLGMTYIVLASRARTTSRAYLRLADEQSRTTLALRPLLREAAMQVIRGSKKSGSALRYHDLLGDRYGSQATTLSVSGRRFIAPSDVNGQLLELTLSSQTNAGRVLTFLDGSPAGTSTRIIDAGDNTVTVLRPNGLEAQSDLSNIREVAVNAADFDGYGFTSGSEYLPNWSLVMDSPNGSQSEDWDSFDLHNMAVGSADLSFTSFHRPVIFGNLVADYKREYGLANDSEVIAKIVALITGDEATDDAFKAEFIKRVRRASVRPFAFDHKPQQESTIDFTGKAIDSAGLWATLTSVKDVDTDGDGQFDSVWVDFGEQPFAMADGTLVKPLAAINCIDLGGRLNVNAHGSLAHLASDPLWTADNRLAKSAGAIPAIASGLGFGPGDVRIDSVLSSTPAIDAPLLGVSLDYSNGRFRRRLGNTVGRYGDGVTTISSPAMPRGPRSRSRPGLNLFVGSPADYWGKLSVGLDHRGHPLFFDRLTHVSDTGISPYELDLSGSRDSDSHARSGNDPFVSPEVDQPFTPSEMEAVLRLNDPDNASTLPPRLLAMLLGDLSARNLITTDSWDTPGFIGSLPTLALKRDFLNNTEIGRGLRTDLNRPFGDGTDSDGDGVVDEPDETGMGPDSQDRDPPLPANHADPFGGVGSASSPKWEDCGLTRGINLLAHLNIGDQPGRAYAGLRARQVMAENLFRIGRYVAPAYPVKSMAQWAVNVVDFLDADSIMTPFRYSDGTSATSVVWGSEHPDLIITETLAFHDRGIADTDQESPSGAKTSDTTPDADFDQIRVPQGSLFIELYAVRDPNAAKSLPAELYTDGFLDLGRTPLNQTARGTAPVWRLSISKLRGSLDSKNDPFLFLRNNPGNEWFSPQGSSVADFIGTDGQYNAQGQLQSNNGGSVPLERYVWFNTVQSGTATNASDPSPNEFNTFRLAGGSNQLKPGNYLVVGPRPETYLGSRVGAKYGERSPQRIVLNNQASPSDLVYGFNPSNPSDISGQINPTRTGVNGFDSLPPVGGRSETQTCWVQAKGPSWADIAHTIGLNISEKRGDNYYDQPPKQLNNSQFTSPPYGSLADPSEHFRDAPQDNGWPLGNAGLLGQGTHLNVATVFLERLADPTRPHDPVAEINEISGDNTSPLITNPDWNPYIVVDLMPVDLTVFNGETRVRDPSVPQNKDFYFHTRQRGFDAWYDKDGTEPFDLAQTLDTRYPRVVENPWRPLMPYGKDFADTTPTKPQADTTTARPANEAVAHFAHELGIVRDTNGEQKNDIPVHTLGWVNLSNGRRLGNSEVPASYAGSPSTPFPWIVWNDRPFANEYELLYVPRTPASRLLTDYRDIDSDPVPRKIAGEDNPDYDRGPFGASQPGWHLLPLTSITDEPEKNYANDLSKIFSFVRVQSPFKGTTTTIDPDDPTTPAVFRAPFNQVPTFREPGHVNINTIPSGTAGSPLWNAICGVSSPTPDWAAIATYRDTITAFRSRTSAPRNETLLATNDNVTPPQPLFTAPTAPNPPGSIHTAFSPEKSTWFRFHNLTRAASNTTTRSELYAIWVTVGFFEVAPAGGPGLLRNTEYPGAPPDAFDPLPVRRYPDELRLVREYGLATGDARRYRAFYLFDRSRPVCYEPGADHNVSDAILVERFIE